MPVLDRCSGGSWRLVRHCLSGCWSRNCTGGTAFNEAEIYSKQRLWFVRISSPARHLALKTIKKRSFRSLAEDRESLVEEAKHFLLHNITNPKEAIKSASIRMTYYRPHTQSSWYINQLSQDRWGTDVPTLRRDIDRLERRLRNRSEDLLRRDRELNDLRHRHERLRSNYNTIFNAYDRCLDLLRDERRRWRRIR